jgi:hypothetical protein
MCYMTDSNGIRQLYFVTDSYCSMSIRSERLTTSLDIGLANFTLKDSSYFSLAFLWMIVN